MNYREMTSTCESCLTIISAGDHPYCDTCWNNGEPGYWGRTEADDTIVDELDQMRARLRAAYAVFGDNPDLVDLMCREEVILTLESHDEAFSKAFFEDHLPF